MLKISFRCVRKKHRHLWKNSSDGFFYKDYRNRNRKQLVPAVVSFAKQGTEAETTYGPGRPTRPLDAKFFKKKLRCRSALESVFAGILDQFSRVSSTQKTCFQTQKCWKFDKFTFWESNI